MSETVSREVIGVVIDCVQHMIDEERRPVVLGIREDWGCDDLQEDYVRRIIERIRDAATNDVSLSLGPTEARTLFAYMLAKETQAELDRMSRRRRY